MFLRLPFISAATHDHWVHIFCIAITNMGGGRAPCRLGYTQLRSAKLECLATSPVTVTSRSWLHFYVMPCAFLWKCLRCFIIKKGIVVLMQVLRHRLLQLSSHLPVSDCIFQRSEIKLWCGSDECVEELGFCCRCRWALTLREERRLRLSESGC